MKLEHPDLIALERDGLASAMRRYNNLSKKHERVIDKRRVVMHLEQYRDILNNSDLNFASLIRSVENVLNEAMVFIGDEAEFFTRRYTQSVNAFKQLKALDLYERNPCYKPT